MDIKEKIDKDKEALILLKEKKDKLNEKIKKLEERIEKNTTILNDMRFNELNEVIKSKGLNIDEILEAVRAGDLLSIQNKLLQEDKSQNKLLQEDNNMKVIEGGKAGRV